MEKITNREIKAIETTHEFFCDECGTKIGESIECNDGWYPEYGEYDQSFNISGIGWYKLHKNLCTNCVNMYNTKIKEALKSLGFEKD